MVPIRNFRPTVPLKYQSTETLLKSDQMINKTYLNDSMVYLLGALGIGFGTYLPYHYAQSADLKNIESEKIDKKDEIRLKKIKETYAYTIGNLVTIFSSGAIFYKTRALSLVLNSNKWVALIGTLGLTLPFLIGTLATPYDQTHQKHFLNTGFNITSGLSMCTLGLFGGGLIFNAALGTIGMMGGLSTYVLCNKDKKFNQYDSALSVFLGVSVIGSLAWMIFPQSKLLESFMIYGGIAMYGGFTMSDTQKMLKKIEEDINKDQGKSYDPINESLGLTLDAIGIFVRLLMILAKQEEKNKYISSLVEKK
jgi:hypothetical protein